MVASKIRKANYKILLDHDNYYMYINQEIITIKNYDNETIFKGHLDCPDELNTLMYQLGITKI